MPQILFVLTGDGRPEKLNRYSAGLLLAAMTVKHFHPDIPVVCLGDEYGERLLCGGNSMAASAVDRFISCPDATGGPVHRSRVIKTTLRRRVDGSFVYLDSDIALISDIRELLECPLPLGLTLDSWFPESIGKFPDWCAPVYRNLDWKHPTARYYNSGVLFADDSPSAFALFDEWHERYAQSVSLGINLDQPAFNSAVENLATPIREYPEDYNFFCGKVPRSIPASARLLHVCCSLPATKIPAYEEAITKLQKGGEVDVRKLVEALKTSREQETTKWHFFWDLQRRAGEFVQRHLCRMKWDSANRY